MYYTHLRADCNNSVSPHFRNTRPVTILHHRHIRRCVLHSTAACFAISLRGNCYRWERCHHAGGAVVQLCREIPVCWPQCFSTGLFCGLRHNPIRFQRLFLPTFSGKAEKVGLRSNSCGPAANSASPVPTGKSPSTLRFMLTKPFFWVRLSVVIFCDDKDK